MPMKLGIDDYLAQNRAWPREAYLALERVPLTHALFKPCHAWLQHKEALETEQQARKTQELDGLREVPVNTLQPRTDELLAFTGERADWKLVLATEKLSPRIVSRPRAAGGTSRGA
mgnify:CR=1 FL=1